MIYISIILKAYTSTPSEDWLKSNIDYVENNVDDNHGSESILIKLKTYTCTPSQKLRWREVQ